MSTFGFMVGRVESVNDGENLGRIRVELPVLDGLLTDWIEVATLGATSGGGVWAMPQVGDEVMVARLADGAFVVVGGRWNRAALPPEPHQQDGENDIAVIRTRGGVGMVCNDKANLVLTEPSGQSALVLGELAPSGSGDNVLGIQHVGSAKKGLGASSKVVELVAKGDIQISCGSLEITAQDVTLAGNSAKLAAKSSVAVTSVAVLKVGGASVGVS